MSAEPTSSGLDPVGDLFRRRQRRRDVQLALAAERLARNLGALLDRALLRDGVVHAGELGSGSLDRADGIVDERVGAVVDRGSGAERLDQVKVGRRARRHDRDARRDRELDRRRPDRGRTAVDEDDFALRFCRIRLWERQVEVVPLVQTGGGGRQSEREDRRLVERDRIRDRRGEERADDRVFLESRVFRLARTESGAVPVRGQDSIRSPGRRKERSATHARTRSPFLTLVTPSATSTTVPATSVPRMNGYSLTKKS